MTYKLDQELIEKIMKEIEPRETQNHFEEMIATIDRVIEQNKIFNIGKSFKEKERLNPIYFKIKQLYQLLLDYHQYEDKNIKEITKCTRLIHIKTNIPTYYYGKVHKLPFVNISGIYVPIEVYLIPYDVNEMYLKETNIDKKEEELAFKLTGKYIDGMLYGKAEHLNIITNSLAVAIDKDHWINEFFKSPKNYEYLYVC